jgi:hypothetical protein
MEAAMYKGLATVAGTVAIASAALLTPAQAGGGSASAPSKYGHSSQVATYQAPTNRRAKPSDFPITEYSSSSARTHGAKYR